MGRPLLIRAHTYLETDTSSQRRLWSVAKPTGEEIIASQVADALHASRASVSSALGRLAILNMVTRRDAGEWRGSSRAAPYTRNEHLLWEPLTALCAAILEQDETRAD